MKFRLYKTDCKIFSQTAAVFVAVFLLPHLYLLRLCTFAARCRWIPTILARRCTVLAAGILLSGQCHFSKLLHVLVILAGIVI